VTTAALTKATQELEAAKKEAIAAGDPTKFKQNAAKAMNTFVEKLPTLTLQQSIDKKPGETHVGIVGNTSAGKSTFLNALLGLKLAVSMDHCTENCEVVARRGSRVYWDVAGRNDQFEFYKVETLAFLKSLDVLIIAYCDDIGMITNIVRVASALGIKRIILLRTKVDQFRATDAHTLEQTRRRDEQLAGSLCTGADVYFVSAHNVMDGSGSKYDWDRLTKDIC
jgi:small GTP-binding protein